MSPFNQDDRNDLPVGLPVDLPSAANLLGSAQAKANVNIALIKYWGKAESETNLPAVGSLSLTLDEWGSETQVTWFTSTDASLAKHRFILNGQEKSDAKVERLLEHLLQLAESHHHPWAKPKQVWAQVNSINTVPTASGLASSASGMAALGLAAWSALGWSNPLEATLNDDFTPPAHKLIDLVRIGSGSAVRSLLGGLVRLERDGQTMKQLQVANEWPLALVVCVVDPGPKAVSSREGMERTRQTSPYYQAWVDSHEADLDEAEKAVQQKDLSRLGELMEHSTFKMHSVMWSARPPLRYVKGTSLEALDQVESIRQAGIQAWATMDAGPHVKVLCFQKDIAYISEQLKKVKGLHSCIVRYPGQAAHILKRAPIIGKDS